MLGQMWAVLIVLSSRRLMLSQQLLLAKFYSSALRETLHIHHCHFSEHNLAGTTMPRGVHCVAALGSRVVIFACVFSVSLLAIPRCRALNMADTRGQIDGVYYLSNDAGQFLDALVYATEIVLMESIVFPTSFPQQTPIVIKGNRTVTIRGGHPADIAGPGPPKTTNVPVLDFNFHYPVIQVGAGSLVEFKDLIITNIPSKYWPEIIASPLPRAVGMDFWPTVLADVGSTIVLSNVLGYTYSRHLSCSEHCLRESVLNMGYVFGNVYLAGYHTSTNSTYLLGTHNIPILVRSADAQQTLGTVKLVANGTAWGCRVDPRSDSTIYTSPGSISSISGPGATTQQQIPSTFGGEPLSTSASANAGNPSSGSAGGSNSSSSGTSLSTGAWVGIGVGIAVGALVAMAVGYATVVRKRRLMLQSLPVHLAGPPAKDDDGSHTVATAGAGRSGHTSQILTTLNRSHQELGIASALRVRFGGLEGLEIGNLIGRGAHGRIYKGSMRGVPVAVKVVEHVEGSGLGLSPSPAESPKRIDTNGAHEAVTGEAVMLTALAHPNIVRVYRVASIKLHNCSGLSALSQRSTSKNNVVGVAGEPPIPIPIIEARGEKERLEEKRSGSPSTNSFPSCTSTAYHHEKAALARPNGSPAGDVAASVAGGGVAQHRQEHDMQLQGKHTAPQILPSPQDEELRAGSPEAVRLSLGDRSFNEKPSIRETWLILEFCEKGSLDAAIRRGWFRNSYGQPRLSLILHVLRDIAQGVEFLHNSANIIHGDLKPANVLLKNGTEETLTAVVADFGLSHMLQGQNSSIQRTASLGTLEYLAPELLAGRLTRAADVWAFGLIALELWDGEGAYANLSSGHIMLLLSGGGNPPPAPENCPYKNVIEACLRWNPSERCTFTNIVEALQRIEA